MIKTKYIIEFRQFKRFARLNRCDIQVWRRHKDINQQKIYFTNFYNVSRSSVDRMRRLTNLVRMPDSLNWNVYLPK